MAQTTTQTPAERLLEKLRQALEEPGNQLDLSEPGLGSAWNLIKILESHDALVAVLTDILTSEMVRMSTPQRVELHIITTEERRQAAQAALRLALEHR